MEKSRKKTEKPQEIVFPDRVGVIAKVSDIQEFKTTDTTMYGINITMKNGDHMSKWVPAESRLELLPFREGEKLIYRMKKTITGDKEKTRLDYYSFMLGAAVQIEQDIPREIVKCVSFSAAYAKDLCISTGDVDEFEKMANTIFEWCKHTLINLKNNAENEF